MGRREEYSSQKFPPGKNILDRIFPDNLKGGNIPGRKSPEEKIGEGGGVGRNILGKISPQGGLS